MKVLILGIDGYIGYPLALHLLKSGYEVAGVDNLSRRKRVEQIPGNSLTPIASIHTRSRYLRSHPNFIDNVAAINLEDHYITSRILREFKPDAIVHLAEQPSAPWSMQGPRQSIDTQSGNVLGTLALLWAMRSECPEAHLIKLGTMGEYGTPFCDIPEGVIPDRPCDYGASKDICPMSGLLFPRSPGSFYHLSKVHDTYNVKFACDTWGLRSTDIMQGVLFGVSTKEGAEIVELTRFDYDEYFGTAINRFCVQSLVGHPLTVYGEGHQTRGFLPLKDSIQCLQIAIDNPPSSGEYRTYNQFENIYTINELAWMVKDAGEEIGFPTTIDHISNPRAELENHYYNPAHQKLFDLGYQPTLNIADEILNLMIQLKPFRARCIPENIPPKTTWK